MLDRDCDTLPKFVQRHARRNPDGVAMRRKTLGAWQPITWSDYWREVELICAGLLAGTSKDAACIAMIGDNEPELFWIEIAVQAAGCAATCVYPDISAEELLHHLRDCGAKVVFAEDQEQCDKLLKIADEAGLERIVYWDDRGMASCRDRRVVSLDALRSQGRELLGRDPEAVRTAVARGCADDLAVVIYTSGTTGRPKGVMGSHRYLLDISARWRNVLEIPANVDYVSYISPAWATEQYLGVALGVSLPMTVNFPEEPETVTADMREIGPEFLFFSPRQWEAIVSSTEARMRDASAPVRAIYRWSMATLASQYRRSGFVAALKRKLADILVGRPLRDRLGFTYLRSAVNSGSTLSPEVYDFFGSLGLQLRNVYGFTEIGIVTATRDGDPNDTGGGVLLSEHGDTPLQIRIQDHEIQVRGGVIFGGYYDRQDDSAERFTADGWVRSGDAGRFDAQRRLIYLDRLEDLRTLSNGETIAPQFIETRARLSPYIRDLIIVGAGREAPAALVDIDVDMVGRWAEAKRISFTSQVDLSQNKDVYALIDAELRALNLNLPEGSRISRFVNLFKPFDADEGELTRSRKLRRVVVENKYADLIDAVYSGKSNVRISIEMKYQDGRSRALNADVTIRSLDEPASQYAAVA